MLGPIPGGDPDRFTVAGVRSRSLAVRSILSHFDELDAERRRILGD